MNKTYDELVALAHSQEGGFFAAAYLVLTQLGAGHKALPTIAKEIHLEMDKVIPTGRKFTYVDMFARVYSYNNVPDVVHEYVSLILSGLTYPVREEEEREIKFALRMDREDTIFNDALFVLEHCSLNAAGERK